MPLQPKKKKKKKKAKGVSYSPKAVTKKTNPNNARTGVAKKKKRKTSYKDKNGVWRGPSGSRLAYPPKGK